jgi:hypothetical protein
MQDTAQLIAIILLSAFAIERILAAAAFALGDAPADDARAARRYKLLLAVLGGALALLVIDKGGVRILERMQPQQPLSLLDYWLTWLVLFAGSDRVKDFIGGVPSAVAAKPAAPPVPPIRIEVDEGLAARRVA